MTEIPVALAAVLAAGTVAALCLAFYLARVRGQLNGLRARASRAEEEGIASHHRAAETASRLQSTEARLHAAEAELRHLLSARLPDTVTRAGHAHVPVRGPLHPGAVSVEFDQTMQGLLDQVTQAIHKERLRVDSAAQAALRGATTTIQALLYQVQTLLQEMQERHDDPLIAQDLLNADFLNEQALRRIQATAVVCGAWPGLTRQDSHLPDMVVGATSRIQGYERIQIANQLRDPVGVVARAVEPVTVALTELMANALHYSHHDLPVAVTLQQGNRGASVIIDDAGVGLHDDELQRARRLMSGQEQPLLSELGDPPRSGFAAVGQLIRQYGFQAHVETSPYGGVRAIVHIPGDPLLTLLDQEEQPMSAMAPLPPTPAPPLHAPTESVPVEVENPSSSGDDLPRRRRRQPVAEESLSEPVIGSQREATGEHTLPTENPEPASNPEESAQRWAAFQQGTASGRAAAAEGDTGPETENRPSPPQSEGHSPS
ncbi:sensor histidine kinase [Streptomyces sp. NPDC005438]|uniref:ATP-binding protein n=1 Tax=Streptomyces sp. NPDC005438 TaxID=3156880 RepID=UPI0033AE7280